MKQLTNSYYNKKQSLVKQILLIFDSASKDVTNPICVK